MESVFEIAKKHLQGNDAEFFQRVWNQDLTVYENRIKAIDFKGMTNVLDAGFGVGQWLVNLAKLNNRVYGIEYSPERVAAVESIIKRLGVGNCNLQQGSIESLPYEDSFFDAIFCYGVIFLTDVRKSLKEFQRVLKPGGKLYISVSGLGWFTMLIIEEKNKSEAYDPRRAAMEAIENTIFYLEDETITPGQQVIIPSKLISRYLQELGFNNTIIDGDGKINITNQKNVISFYQKEYLGNEFVYELLTQKK